MVTRQEILNAAAACVNGDRDVKYGRPEDSFRLIARLWNDYLRGGEAKNSVHLDIIGVRDVAAMLALLKIARIRGGQSHADNWIDLAGYAACGGEIEGKYENNAGESRTSGGTEQTRPQ